MQINLKIISQIRNKLKFLIENKEVLDVLIFGSIIKGKPIPSDIDIAVIIKKELPEKIKEKLKKLNNFHISIITLEEFFVNKPSIVNTLLREGYSIKNKKYFAENFRFLNKVLFVYFLTNLNASKKVKVVNILKGKDKEIGLVKKYKGEWLAKQVFVVPVGSENLFEEFFNNFKIKFKKYYVLMH